jgi:hypothetical protein
MVCYWSRVASVLVLVASSVGQDRGSIDPKWASVYIGNVLKGAQASGSLEYWGRCDSNGQSTDFPELRTPENENATTVQTLHEMFSNDPKMRVVQEPDGKIRMVETDVPRDLLDLKISHISFTTHPDPLRNATKALWVILQAPEVKAFMSAHNIGPILPEFFFYSIPSARDSPPISGDLDDATVSQALDYVLQTYPGFWTYENCPRENGGRTVFFNFFSTITPRAIISPRR